MAKNDENKRKVPPYLTPDADRCRKCRLDRNLSQRTLADAIGVSDRTIANIEGGKRVTERTLSRLASFYHREPSELVASEERGVVTGVSGRLRPHLCSFDPYLSFHTYIEERRRGFVGRDFVFGAIKAFLEEPRVSAGYFVITGDPGIGKSAIIAELVADRDKIGTRRRVLYHFNISLGRINTTRQFLESVCAQLITVFDLPHKTLPGTFDQSSAFLSTLLQEVSPRLQRGQELVVLVDALDEVVRDNALSGANPLFLPRDLPAHTYFVVTTRRDASIFIQADNIQSFHLSADGPDNERDIRRYIRHHVNYDGIRTWMRERTLDEAEFVDEMWKKSEGNFMYLRHVLPAIEAGHFAGSGVTDLPSGLRAYYRFHWAQMQQLDRETFECLYQPVVCMLAATPEAVSIAKVVEWTQLEPIQVRQVLNTWAAFLHEEAAMEQETRYRIYHAAFRDFLCDEIDPGLRTYHTTIAESIMAKIQRARES